MLIERFGLFLCCLSLITTSFANVGDAPGFDGVNDFVEVADADALDFGDGDFTISAWIKTGHAPISPNYPMIINKEPGTGNRSGYEMFLLPDQGLNTTAAFQIASGNVFVLVSGTTPVNDGNWHHIAAIKTDSQIEIVVDGVSEGITAHTLISLSNDQPLSFGRAAGNASWYFNGLIAEVRAWGFARTPAEIMADMSTSLTGSETNLAGYWPMNEGTGQVAADLTGNHAGRLGTSTEADFSDPLWLPDVFPHNVVLGSGLWIDGANDAVVVPSAPGLDFGTGDFTISCWVRTRQMPLSGNWPIIIGKESGVYTARTGFDIFLVPTGSGLTSGQVAFQVFSAGQSVAISSYATINDGQWHHLAGVKTASTIEFFLDGQLQRSAAHGLGSVTTTEPLVFGRASAPSQWFYQGQLDEIRVWNYARTRKEIQADMGVPLNGSEANLVGYWRFDEGQGQTTQDMAGSNDGQMGSTVGADVDDPLWLSTDYPLVFFRNVFESLTP